MNIRLLGGLFIFVTACIFKPEKTIPDGGATELNSKRGELSLIAPEVELLWQNPPVYPYLKITAPDNIDYVEVECKCGTETCWQDQWGFNRIDLFWLDKANITAVNARSCSYSSSPEHECSEWKPAVILAPPPDQSGNSNTEEKLQSYKKLDALAQQSYALALTLKEQAKFCVDTPDETLSSLERITAIGLVAYRYLVMNPEFFESQYFEVSHFGSNLTVYQGVHPLNSVLAASLSVGTAPSFGLTGGGSDLQI